MSEMQSCFVINKWFKRSKRKKVPLVSVMQKMWTAFTFLKSFSALFETGGWGGYSSISMTNFMTPYVWLNWKSDLISAQKLKKWAGSRFGKKIRLYQNQMYTSSSNECMQKKHLKKKVYQLIMAAITKKQKWQLILSLRASWRITCSKVAVSCPDASSD